MHINIAPRISLAIIAGTTYIHTEEYTQGASMKIGIFGGTFDPPHWGHLLLAEFAREELALDGVWLMPALQPPHKTTRKISPIGIRYRMVEALCGDDPFIRPSDADMAHGRSPSYTIDLLDELSRKYPENQFTLLIGGDSYIELTTWHRWRQLVRKYAVVALPRPDTDKLVAHPDIRENVKMLSSPLIEISSTDIRQRVSQQRTIRYMTTEAVERIIGEEKLYIGKSI